MDVSIQNEGLSIPRFPSGDMLSLYEDSYESFFKPRLVSPCLGCVASAFFFFFFFSLVLRRIQLDCF